MASTYSPLKIELIGTGEQAGTWGTTTNTNLGTAIEEAIVGSADVAFSSADVTLTLTNTNATQIGRNLRLNLTGTSGGARELILGSGMQIEKLYLVNNGLADAVTVKNTTGTGIAVPAGKTMWVYNNGTNVVDAVTHLSSLTLGAALPIASGGTGITSFGTGVATWLGTPSSANLAAALTDETGSGLAVFGTTPTITGLREKSTAVSASDIDLSAGNYFTKTISGTTTFTVSNVATSGDVAAFVLVLTNGGSATVTFFSGVTWAGGTAPTLTASGVDILGFFTINGGTTWRGLVLALDIKAP